MKELVIKIFWGGLGDHLLYSPIPRLAKQQGYDKVYISTKSNYRNPNTKRLVWEYNPFIDGFVDADANYAQFSIINENENIVDAHVSFFGLGLNAPKFIETEVYYTPKIIPELKKAVIYDPNYASPIKHPSSLAIDTFFKKNKIVPTYQLKRMCNNSLLSGIPELGSRDLEEYCDIIASCSMFFCHVSGPATLAPALGKSANVFYDNSTKKMFLHSKRNIYIEL